MVANEMARCTVQFTSVIFETFATPFPLAFDAFISLDSAARTSFVVAVKGSQIKSQLGRAFSQR